MSSKSRTIAVLLLAGILSLLGVAPAASAATIANGEQLYVFSENGELYKATDSGALTYVGGTANVGPWGIDYDPVTNLAYFFDDHTSPCNLYSLDVTTGNATLVGPITDGVNTFSDCDGLDITDSGDIWVAVNDVDLVRVSAEDASVLEQVTLTGIAPFEEVAFLATDPTTGILYAGDYSNFYSIDLATGVATYLANLGYIESGDFDSNGTFWYQGSGDSCDLGLSSFNPSDIAGTSTFQGDLIDGVDCVYAYAIFILPAGEPDISDDPSLANTGATGTAGLIGLGAGLLLLGLFLGHRARTARVQD